MPSTTGGSVPGGRRRRSAMARLATLLKRRVGVGAGLEVDLDEAHAGQRARFAVIHVGGQREEALEGVGDVGFNLLRRHAVVERGHHHHRHVDVGKQIHGHAAAMVTAPTSATTRHSMRMKKGYWRANFGIIVLPPFAASAFHVDGAAVSCTSSREPGSAWSERAHLLRLPDIFPGRRASRGRPVEPAGDLGQLLSLRSPTWTLRM